MQFTTYRTPDKSRLKRAVDVVGAVAILGFLLPSTGLLIAFLYGRGRGPLFERRETVGLCGKPFAMWCWAAGRRAPLDGVLHRLGVACVPALLNVLKGDMALVGPAPLTLVQHRYLSNTTPSYRGRLATRPGILGVDALEGAAGSDDVRVQREAAYVANWALGRDLKVLLHAARAYFVQSAQR